MRQDYEQILIKALAAAAYERAGGDALIGVRLVDRWIDQATAEYAAELTEDGTPAQGVQPCGHC